MASMSLYSPPPQHISSASDSIHSSSIGPFIAVFIIVAVLCVVAGIIGRLCSGKTIMGYGDYDMERWAESRCSSCIDGNIFPHRPSPPSIQPLQRTSSSVSVESERHVADLDESDGEKQDSIDHEPPLPETSSTDHS